MELEVLLLCLRKPGAFLYPEPDKSSISIQLNYLKSVLILPSIPRSSKWTFSFRSPYQTYVCVTSSAHFTTLHVVDLVVFVDKYTS